MPRSALAAIVPWAASALAAIGVATIGYAGDSLRPFALGLVLLATSASASFAIVRGAFDSGVRLFGTGVACGAFSAAAIAGMPSFGLALLPAAAAWAVGLVAMERPPDPTQIGAAGALAGVGLASVSLLVVSAI